MSRKSSSSYGTFIIVTLLIVVSVAAIVMVMNSSPGRARNLTHNAGEQRDFTIDITTPTAHETVDGQVSVQGTASHSGDYRIEVRDSAGVLGEKTVSISDSDTRSFSILVPITQSPHSGTGEVRVTYHNDSAVKSAVPVIFKTQEVSDRLKLQGPLPNQVMNGSSVTFRGSMKGFFEGVLHVRLMDDRGAVLVSDTINASGDNYEQFSSFEKTVKYGTIVAANLGSGSWEVYDVSPKDGSASALISFPVRFKE